MVEQKLAVIGGNGFIGSNIVEQTRALSPSHNEVDITVRDQVEAWMGAVDIDTVLLVAAYTNTKEAQLNEELVRQINVYGVRIVAEAAKKFNKHLILISTGFVFTGEAENPGPYYENDDPRLGNPALRGVYATTKLEGEEVLKEILGENCAIVRIDFPFGNEKFPNKDFAIKILNFIKSGGKLYGDQYITPTYIPDLIKAIKIISTNKLNGIFHVGSSDLTTTYDFGKMIVEKNGLVYEVGNSKFPIGFLMPKFGGFNTKNTEEFLGINFKTSSEAIEEFVCLASL